MVSIETTINEHQVFREEALRQKVEYTKCVLKQYPKRQFLPAVEENSGFKAQAPFLSTASIRRGVGLPPQIRDQRRLPAWLFPYRQ